MILIRPLDMPRPRHRHSMRVARATLCTGQVIPTIALEEMRPLDQPERRTGIDIAHRPDKLAGLGIIFLQHDAVEGNMTLGMARFRPVVPLLVHEPLAPIVVMEERRVEAGGIHVDRIRPFSLDGRRSHDIVRRILERALEPLHVREDQPELPVRVRQAGSPDSAAVGIAEHIELARTLQRTAHQSPVHQITRMVDLHARKPLESRGRDVIVIADAADRRVRVETGKNGVLDHVAHFFLRAGPLRSAEAAQRLMSASRA